jgi:hypothetical protein
MSRTKITSTNTSVGTDDGNTLFSFIQGEQLEFGVTLGFLSSLSGYTFEAVVMEALNVAGDESVPNAVRPGGINTTLTVRVPPERGNWSASTNYSMNDVVFYNNLYYIRKSGTNVVDSTAPSLSPNWTAYVPNKIYVQFPLTMGSTWAVKATPGVPVHGFFELRVTEPVSAAFPRTWKPLRGVVEILFSPTDVV